MDLITLQEYKSFNSMSANDKEDPKIRMLITSISALIKAYLNGKGTNLPGQDAETITEYISVDYDTNRIYLEKYPVGQIISITEPDRYTVDSTVHVPLSYGADYMVDYANGILFRQRTIGGFANWPLSPSVVTVKYTTGAQADPGTGLFPEVEIPSDIKLAAIYLVNYYRSEEYRQSKTIGGTTEVNTLAKGTDFPLHIQVLLDRYI
jgi:hypothetical protein